MNRNIKKSLYFSNPFSHLHYYTLANKSRLTMSGHILHPNSLHFIPDSDNPQSGENNTLKCHIFRQYLNRGAWQEEVNRCSAVLKQLLLKCPWTTSSCSSEAVQYAYGRKPGFYWATLHWVMHGGSVPYTPSMHVTLRNRPDRYSVWSTLER